MVFQIVRTEIKHLSVLVGYHFLRQQLTFKSTKMVTDMLLSHKKAHFLVFLIYLKDVFLTFFLAWYNDLND